MHIIALCFFLLVFYYIKLYKKFLNGKWRIPQLPPTLLFFKSKSFFDQSAVSIGGRGSSAGALEGARIGALTVHRCLLRQSVMLQWTWLWWISFYFLYQTYLLIGRSLFSLKNANVWWQKHRNAPVNTRRAMTSGIGQHVPVCEEWR